MSINVITIDRHSPYLQEVVELGTRNSSTLGFLPEKAFIEQAQKKKILVAFDEKKRLLGYLLYGINRKEVLAYITHLCVKPSERHRGIAKTLFNELRKLTKDVYRGIRVHCRRDYTIANKVWPKLGFIPRGEKPGRSKHGTRLTIWWFDHNHPNLFTYAANQPTTKLQVVIDANVFYDLQCPVNSANTQSHYLQVDWLQETIELCLTNEIFIEINRQEDHVKRQKARNFVSEFKMLSTSDDNLDTIRKALMPVFPKLESEQDQSDLNQLSRSIAAKVQFFVTRDNPLRKRVADYVYEKFGMRVMRPADLIINQDELLRETEYQPAKLAGSQIYINRPQTGQSDELVSAFYFRTKETKAIFRQKLLPLLADPHSYQLNIVGDADTTLGLIAYGRQENYILDIPLLRISEGSLAPTLARHLIFNAIVTAATEKRHITRITDHYLSDEIIESLRENGFISADNSWIKLNLSLVATSQQLLSHLKLLGVRFVEISNYFAQLKQTLETAIHEKNTQTLLQVERALWPVKIIDAEIPTYIIPILPVWAMHLFDSNISTQDLFGADPNLILRLENIYYRSSSSKILSSPARILWYVSKGKSTYQGIQSIRAYSYLDEVFIDKPKVLYSRFKRFGVYKWKDVFEVTKHNIHKEIMAFRFGHTEMLPFPIPFKELQKIWREKTGKRLSLQSPVKIPSEQFWNFYKVGLHIQ